jgi:hypothetical protein
VLWLCATAPVAIKPAITAAATPVFKNAIFSNSPADPFTSIPYAEPRRDRF